MKKYKYCVLGIDGILGKAFYKKGLFATSYYQKEVPYLDYTNPSIEPYKKELQDYQYALLCGGITNIARCEREKEKAYACNVKGTVSLCHQLCEVGVVPVVFSTDHVFDGKKTHYDEQDPPSPLNEYGRQKAELEHLVKDMALIMRLSKVFSLKEEAGCFIWHMANQLKEKKMLKLAIDQFMSPIFIDDVIKKISMLMDKGETGLFNLCGITSISRYELGRRLAEIVGAEPSLIEKISIDDLEDGIKRPKSIQLSLEKILSVTALQISPLDHGLQLLNSLVRT